jgi:hypothetical protein
MAVPAQNLLFAEAGHFRSRAVKEKDSAVLVVADDPFLETVQEGFQVPQIHHEISWGEIRCEAHMCLISPR